MHSSRMRVILLTAILACGLASSVVAYSIASPQRDVTRLIRVIEQAQVGHTRIEDIAPAGAVAGVRGKSVRRN
jgi:hypothetical protein